MDLLFCIIMELVFFLGEKVVRGIKNGKTQVFAAAIFTFVACVLVTGFITWDAISYYQKGNMLAANCCGALVVLLILFVGFVILRHIIRKRKNKG